MTTPAETSASEVASIPLSPEFGWGWLLALAASAFMVLVLAYSIGALVFIGVGVWGTNVPFVWGFDLTNYVWWIGIANGSTLFAAILVLRRHSLRTAINRFAEGLALFAVICAGIFPIFHLGRPWLFYWMFPYPATFEVWPQFRSPLTWDFWAIITHLIVTTMLWYVGLIPDLATLRDRARPLAAKRVFAAFALGWRGSLRHWALHQRAYRLVAVAVIPIALVIQSTVAFEFSVTLVPDWHETRLPLHYVVSGLESGLALILLAAAILRGSLRLERYISVEDLDLIGKLLLANSLVVGYVHMGEIGSALLAGSYTQTATINRLVGDYAGLYWGAIALTVLLPQALWSPSVRASNPGCILIGLGVTAGVWLDRLSIVVGGLQRDYLPSMWRMYAPTQPEWYLYLGTIGLFAALFLLFVRYLPVISMSETRHDEHREARS
ncbi:MAG: polysulfide reductase NrfD [Hyphomicrobiaceae bacterium]|nr:polysulfide reductase NrfD [Hyphomicrobiaceae bacterium]